MLKTIKKNIQMRLDELIKYVWEDDGSLFEKQSKITFRTEGGDKGVFFEENGSFENLNWFDPEDLFLVEIEEEITEETVFDRLVELYRDAHDEQFRTVNYFNENINYVKDVDTVFIYALIDNKLEIIWERR